MRTLQTIKAGNLAQKHYYTQDQTVLQAAEPDSLEADLEMTHAQWWGRDAARLGLVGYARHPDVGQIFDGYQPGSSERIRQAKPRHDQRENCVIDLVLSCKKSVSLQIHLGNDPRVFSAALAAAQEVAALIEQDYALVRIQTAGVRRIVPTGGLIGLLLPHHTTRAKDPGVHFHLLIANGSYSPDGQWRALADQGLSHVYFLGDYFSARLASRLQDLGYVIQPIRSASGQPSWELAGYSPAALKLFSKRSENPRVSQLVSQGYSRDAALLVTRPAKDSSEPLHFAQSRWRQEAEAQGITALTQPPPPPIFPRERADERLESAIRHCSHHSVSFSRDDLRKFVFQYPTRITMAELDAAIDRHPQLVDYGRCSGQPQIQGRYTTVAALLREIQTIQAWRQGDGVAPPMMAVELAQKALVNQPLKSGQRQAVVGVLSSRNRHQIVHGLAGVGKTTALRHLQALAVSQGVEVLGFAPSIVAAKKLAAELAMPTHTVQKLVKADLELNAKQFLVIDEAGMVSAEMLQVILAKANAVGARVLLVGDTGQNQAIEAGSPMRSLMAHGAEVHQIREIIRQQNQVQRQAVALIADGDGSRALRLLHQQGYVRTLRDPVARSTAVAEAFLQLSPQEQAKTLIVCGTNREKDAIAGKIRQAWLASGRLNQPTACTQLRHRQLTPEAARYSENFQIGDFITLSRTYASTPLHKHQFYQVMARDGAELVVASTGGRRYRFNPSQFKDKQVYSAHRFEVAVGDSLRWTASNKSLGQVNGECLTITAIQGQVATAVSESGQTRQIDLSLPLPVDYTHTSTSYRAQGTDRPRVFVSATNDPTSRREPFYVAISRQTQELQIWAEDYDTLAQRVAESNLQRNPLELLSPQTHPSHERPSPAPANLALTNPVGSASPTQPDGSHPQQYTQPTESASPDHPGTVGSVYQSALGNHHPETGRSGISRTFGGLQISPAHEYRRVDGDGPQPPGCQTPGSGAAPANSGIDAAVCGPDPTQLEPLPETLPEVKLRLLAEAILDWQVDSEIREVAQTQRLALEWAEFTTAWQFQNQGFNAGAVSYNLSALETQFCQEQAQAWFDDFTAPIQVEDYLSAALQDYQAQLHHLREAVQSHAVPSAYPELCQQLKAIPIPEPVQDCPPAFWQPVYKEKPEGISEAHWQEFQRSAIHPELIALNAQSLAGDAVIDRLLSHRLAEMSSGQFVTQPMARLIRRYEQVSAGGWWGNAGINPQSLPNLAMGETPELSLWGCFKPDSPRLDLEKTQRKGREQLIKYEHPLGMKRQLYLPEVPVGLAERIYAQYGISTTPAERVSGLWAVVYRNPQIPITLTEGWKKTLASLSQGVVTIGVSGVNGLYSVTTSSQNQPPQRQLDSGLAVFAQPGREFRFAFDQDTKPQTVANVRRELVRGVELLQARGCVCKIVHWPPEQGKGLDDLIVAQSPLAYRQAQAAAIEPEIIKSQHYQALYRALARSVAKQQPGLVGVALDAAVYRLAIQRGEVADGVRVICHSPLALKLADPELVRAYVAEVKVIAQEMAFQSLAATENFARAR